MFLLFVIDPTKGVIPKRPTLKKASPKRQSPKYPSPKRQSPKYPSPKRPQSEMSLMNCDFNGYANHVMH